ncbi:MAG: recombination-associated protein RdgC [Pseudomonadota bacterium]
MFRSLRFYRVDTDWPADEAELSARLESCAFKPCPAFSESSLGFEAPVADAGDLLCRTVAGADLMQLRIQTRVLPTAVVREGVEERVDSFKARTARDPSRKEKRELKDEVYAQLLPKALLRSDRVRVFYIRAEKVLAVTTPSANAAERILDVLREALGSLPAVPLAFKLVPEVLMTKVFLGDAPRTYGLGHECRMKDKADLKAKVSFSDMDLTDASVRKHLSDGMSLDRLAFSFDGVLRATLDEDLVLRKIKLEGIEELDDLDEEDPLARHDAEFTLYCGLLTRWLQSMSKELQGYAG